jgi:hypothetical protein
MEESDHNGNKWHHFLAVIFSFILNLLVLLLVKRGWGRLTVHQKRRLIAGIVVWSWMLFGLIVFISIFFPDEITAIHESRSREAASALIGSVFAIVVYVVTRKKTR